MIIASGRLRMRTQFEDMMPQDIPQVVEFQNIIDDYTSTTPITIAIESKSKDVALMKKCADDISKRLEKLVRIKPKEGQKLNLRQQWGIMTNKFPVEGVEYDTVKLVKRIDSKIDNEFFSNHMMMVQKKKDLMTFMDMYSSIRLPELIANINNNFEKEFVDDADNLNSLDGESEAIQGLESIYKYIRSIDRFTDNQDSSQVVNAINEFVSIPEYMISSDNTLLIMMLHENVSINDQLDDAMNLGVQVIDSLDAYKTLYPDLTLGAAGGMALQVDENRALAQDFGPVKMAVTLILILILLIGSFRSWKNPFYSVITLFISIIWVTGFLALVLQYLNMMSASFGLILIGLGIDFGIHLMSGYRDGREQGLNTEDSIINMYEKVASGIVTGALTTAIVFYMMALIKFKAYTEMGIAVGSGIVITLVTMMVLLPAIIVFDNKGYSVTGNMFRRIHLGFIPTVFNLPVNGIFGIFRLKIFSTLTKPLQFRFLEGIGRMVSNIRFAVFIVLAGLAATYFSFDAGRKIEFEYDMMELEPVGIPSGITQDKVLEKFEISTDYALLRVKDLDECRDIIQKLKKEGNRTELIGRVDGITEYLPTIKEQEENIPLINNFRDRMKDLPVPGEYTNEDHIQLLDELKRLHQNIVEIGELSITGSGENNKIIRKCDDIVGQKDEDSKILAILSKFSQHENIETILRKYQEISSEVLKEKLIQMTSTEIITVDKLPGEIRDQYTNPNNKNLLVTVYPKSNIWEQRVLEKFHEVTSKISEKITGMPAIMLLYIEIMKEKGLQAVLLGLCAIVVFLMLDFQSIRNTALAVISLLMGATWMVGFMAVFGIKFNFINFMALPLIIGIGIDDSVHIIHRYKIEGPGKIPTILRFTGRAILLTSLTTMIGFGSWGLASHRGIASMGQVLFLGVGSCFLSSSIVLPALMFIIDKIFPPKKTQKKNEYKNIEKNRTETLVKEL
jgi:hypothetical protein